MIRYVFRENKQHMTSSTANPGEEAGADVGSFPAGTYPKPFERDWSKWNDAVSAERVAELQREGWTVIDGFLQGGIDAESGGGGGGCGVDEASGGDGGAWASALREEIKWLATTGLMRPNRTHFANPKVRTPVVPLL